MPFSFWGILKKVNVMEVRLGYVAISRTLLESYCHTMTYTRFQALTEEERFEKWTLLVKENLKNLKKILQYNVKNKIAFFRISQTLIPLATHPEMKYDYLTPFEKNWKEIGNYIKKHNLRVDFHPDQFCLLNSRKEECFPNALRTLEYLEKISKGMGLFLPIILHVGSREGGKEEALERFKTNFYKLPKSIQTRIVLENDDRSYTVEDTLTLCKELQVPMVLDVLHDKCNPSPKPLAFYFQEILKTWDNYPTLPKIHFSSSLNQTYKWYHSEYIKWQDFQKFLPLLESAQRNVDIMLEAKAKDEALFRLRRQLKLYNKTSIRFK